MNEVTVHRSIAAPPERVWSVITDLAGSPETITSIDAVDIVHGDEFDVGTTWDETRTMFGKTVTERMEVTAVDEPNSYVVESDSRGTHYVSTFTLVADADHGSVLTMSFSGEPSGTAARVFASVMARMFASATRKAIEQDLADIAAAAEAD